MTIRRKVREMNDGNDQPTHWEVWYQHSGGADEFSSDAHPGEVLTDAQLKAKPVRRGWGRIVVVREGAAPPVWPES